MTDDALKKYWPLKPWQVSVSGPISDEALHAFEHWLAAARSTPPAPHTIMAVLRDLVNFMDAAPQLSWGEEFVNVLIAYAEARGIDRDRFVSDVLTAEWTENG